MNFQHNLAYAPTGQAPRCAHTTEFFEGLPDGVKHTDLLRLVQNVARRIGLSSAAVNHLRYLVTHTRKIDWRAGAVPIVYRSVQMTATDLNCCEKTVYNLERSLYQAGLLQWRDREDHKRFGKRNSKGEIEYAYGVDLTPLGKSYDRLVELNESHIAYMEAWADLKRCLSSTRKQVVNKMKWANELCIDVEDLADTFNALPRTRAGMALTDMTDILNKVRAIHSELDLLIDDRRKSMADERSDTASETKESTDASVKSYRHIQPTVSPKSIYIDCNQDDDDDRKDVGEKYACGLEHISYEQVLDAASDEFVELVRPSADPYKDLALAAMARCRDLGIGRYAWMRACAIMGETAAAVAVVIIDRNRAHPLIPVVNPGGVLSGMTAKAKTGDLHLHRSLYAILRRNSTR